MNRLSLTVLLSLSMSSSALAAPNLDDALSDHKVLQSINSAMASMEAAEKERLKILEDLPATLAAEFLVPSVTEGAFSGADDALTYSGQVTHTAAGDTKSVLDAISTAIGTERGGDTVCVSTVGGNVQTISIDTPTMPALLKALGTSTEALAPSTHYLAKVGDKSIVLAESLLGSTLFAAVSEATEGLRGDDKLRIQLDAGANGAGAADKPVQLLLTTVDGQKLKLEVELDAPKKSAADSVPEGAVWRVAGSSIRAPFDKTSAGQVLLLTTLLKEGRLSLGDVETVVTYPTHFAKVSGPDYTVELLGDDNAWFGSAKLGVAGAVTVNRSAGDCQLNVLFSAADSSVGFGPLPEATWKRANSFRAVRTDQTEVALGYLNGPACASNPAGISNEDFDEVMGRGGVCQKRCDDLAAKITEATAKLMESKVGTDEQLSVSKSFTSIACRSTCMKSKGYRDCTQQALKSFTPTSVLDKAKSCEDRKPQ